jgi:phosphomannomutase
MGEAPLIVGVSGLRGIVGESLTPEVAVRYAGAFGGWLWEQVNSDRKRPRSPVVAIASDGRLGGQAIEWAVMSGLQAAGCSVVRLFVATTPTLAFVVDDSNLDAGVMITASHNPQEWNGIKVITRETRRKGARCASAPRAEVAQSIIDRFRDGEVRQASWKEVGLEGNLWAETLAHPNHVLGCLTNMKMRRKLKRRKLTVVCDDVRCSGHHAAGVFLRQVTDADYWYKIEVEAGVFPHTPEPTKENLRGFARFVKAEKADIGFAQDPDADRLAIIDEKGRYIGEEYTLALCAEAVLASREGMRKTPVLVANLSTSRMIDDVAAQHGGRVVRTPVGEANVVEVMKRLKAEGQNVVLGGEGNGGVIWPEVVYVRDSLGSMALVLSLMARTGKTVSELVAQIDSYSPGGAGYAIVKQKVNIASKADAQPAVEKIAKHYDGDGGDPHGRDARATVDLQDGVRVDFPEAGVWVHVRASNTEPIMRLIAEAPTREAAEGILAEVEGVIAG